MGPFGCLKSTSSQFQSDHLPCPISGGRMRCLHLHLLTGWMATEHSMVILRRNSIIIKCNWRHWDVRLYFYFCS